MYNQQRQTIWLNFNMNKSDTHFAVQYYQTSFKSKNDLKSGFFATAIIDNRKSFTFNQYTHITIQI